MIIGDIKNIIYVPFAFSLLRDSEYNLPVASCLLCWIIIDDDMYTCMWLDVCTGMWCICLCGGWSWMLGIFLNCSPPYKLRQSLSRNSELTVQVLYQASLISAYVSLHLCLQSTEFQAGHHSCLVFMWVLGHRTPVLLLAWQVVYTLGHLFCPSKILHS